MMVAHNRTRHLRALTFGGCGLNNPIGTLYRQGKMTLLYREMGFSRTPYALSSAAAVQLMRFITGEIEIPEVIRRFCFVDSKHRPHGEQIDLVARADCALVEMSTPIEIRFEGVVLNTNRFEEILLPTLKGYGIQPKLISRWRSALVNQKEETQAQTSQELLALLPTATEEERWLRAFVSSVRSRRLSLDEMTEHLAHLQRRLGLPMGLIHHNFQYLPDGRPVSWPPEFKDESIEVGRRLGVLTLDFAPFVAEHGTPRVMASDNRHWNPDFYPQIADRLYGFISSVVSQAKGATAVGPAEAEAHPLLDPECLNMVLVLGQSWALGANADTTGDLPATPNSEHPGQALMCDCGPAPRGRRIRGLVDLRESRHGSTVETPCSGIADQIMRCCQQQFGRKPQLLLSAVGRGGTTITGEGQTPDDGLLRGSAQHQEVLRQVREAVKLAAPLGRRLRLLAICLAHGEADAGYGTPAEAYTEALLQLRRSYEEDVRALTGQAEPVPLLTYQTNRGVSRLGTEPAVAVAQLNASARDPLIRCVGPVYAYEPEQRAAGRATHLKAEGYRRMGLQFGIFLMGEQLGLELSPLRVMEHAWLNRTTILLTYPEPVTIERDDALVNVSDLGPGRGIEFYDDSRGSPGIAAIAQLPEAPEQVRVTLTAEPQGPQPRLFIAAKPTGERGCGRLEGARSAIRSSAPIDTDPRDQKPVFNWACTEVIHLGQPA